MNYIELVQLYFERSTALQWYWTVYILVIGGLLAFSSMRQRKDAITTLLVSILYVCFAYKNLGAIEDTTLERAAVLTSIKEHTPGAAEAADVRRLRDGLEPSLQPSTVNEVRYFHIATDLLTVMALWAMELRRRRAESDAI
jgi:hypothetical protein